MIVRRFSIIIFFIASSLSYSMVPDSLNEGERNLFRVDSISISGNDITQDKIILRELTFKVGDWITTEDLLFNRERIYSLGLFNNVTISPVIDNKISSISIVVEEGWYIYPIPIVDMRDSDLKKLTFGLNLLYKNFRGMNETVSAVFAFGYEPFFNLSYYNPWLIRVSNISLSIGFSYNKIHNYSPLAKYLYGGDFNYKFIAGYVNIGKRFNLFNETYLLLGYDYIEIPQLVNGINTASQNRIDRPIKLGMTYIYDNRNLKQFPDSGFYANINYTHRGFDLNNINYSSINLDFRFYEKIIGELTGKLRISSRFALGSSIPFYDNSFIGYRERIRGHYNDVIEGHHYYLFTADFKYPIIKEWYLSFKLPLIPQELTTYRIGVYGNIFGDAGTTQYKNEVLKISDFYSGYGFGLILVILPYNIARVQYAINEYSKGEIIFDLGFTF